MNLNDAITVIESATGFGDETTSVGKAFAIVLASLNSAPAPISVSERLPEARDCDAKGRCWWLIAGCESWILSKQCFAHGTHWLPAPALPLPSEEVE